MKKLKKPLLTVIFLYSICYLFRVIEYFLIQTDRTFWGLAFGTVLFAVAYGAEILIAVSSGRFQTLRLYISSYTMEGNAGNETGLLFFLICIMGNIINVLMEEGIFRGLFQKLLLLCPPPAKSAPPITVYGIPAYTHDLRKSLFHAGLWGLPVNL